MSDEPSTDALFDPTKIDAVGMSASGVVELAIIQDQPWTGSDAQLMSLRQKVQTYVSYAIDGQLAADFPDVAGRPWRVFVHCQTGPPDSRTQEVLDGLAARLEEYGGSLVASERYF